MWRTVPTTDDPGSTVSGDGEGPPLSAGPVPVPLPDRQDPTEPLGTLAAPDLRGMAAPDARRIARMSDLHVVVSTHATEEALWDRVVAQEPAPGVALRPGDTVMIKVGERPTVLVPDVRGGEETEMLVVLRDAGLRPARRVPRRSDSVPEGHVVRTRPRAGSSVPQGTKVTYIVATPRPVHGKRARRHEERVRLRHRPDGSHPSQQFDDVA